MESINKSREKKIKIELRVRSVTEFVVFVRRKPRGSELGQHLSRVFESVSEIVRILRKLKSTVPSTIRFQIVDGIGFEIVGIH